MKFLKIQKQDAYYIKYELVDNWSRFYSIFLPISIIVFIQNNIENRLRSSSILLLT